MCRRRNVTKSSLNWVIDRSLSSNDDTPSIPLYKIFYSRHKWRRFKITLTNDLSKLAKWRNSSKQKNDFLREKNFRKISKKIVFKTFFQKEFSTRKIFFSKYFKLIFRKIKSSKIDPWKMGHDQFWSFLKDLYSKVSDYKEMVYILIL